MTVKFVPRSDYEAIIRRTNEAIACGANPREMAAECSIKWSVFERLVEKKDRQGQISVLQFNRMTAWLDAHEYGTKICSNCGRTLPLGSFNKHAKRKDGHQDWCRECMNDSRQQKKESDAIMAEIAASVVQKVKAEDKPEYEAKFMAAYFGITPDQLGEIRAGKWDKLLLTSAPKPAETTKDALEQLRVELCELRNLVESMVLQFGGELPKGKK